MEQKEKPKQAAEIIFSDDFMDWAQATVQAHFSNLELEAKLSNAIEALKKSVEFRLTVPTFTKNENGGTSHESQARLKVLRACLVPINSSQGPP